MKEIRGAERALALSLRFSLWSLLPTRRRKHSLTRNVHVVCLQGSLLPPFPPVFHPVTSRALIRRDIPWSVAGVGGQPLTRRAPGTRGARPARMRRSRWWCSARRLASARSAVPAYARADRREEAISHKNPINSRPHLAPRARAKQSANARRLWLPLLP